MSVMEDISKALIAGEVEEVKKLAQEAIRGGAKAQEVLDKGLLPGMDYVGERFKNAEMFMPEVLLSARAMSGAVEILAPHFGGGGAKMRGKVVVGTVKGDLHDIGKNLVKVMLRTAGFEVVDLGIDVSPEAFVKGVKEHKPDIVGMSALLTTTMQQMPKVVEALKAAGVRKNVKVMVGGVPVTPAYAKEIGADGYGADAIEAAELARKLVKA